MNSERFFLGVSKDRSNEKSTGGFNKFRLRNVPEYGVWGRVRLNTLSASLRILFYVANSSNICTSTLEYPYLLNILVNTIFCMNLCAISAKICWFEYTYFTCPLVN